MTKVRRGDFVRLRAMLARRLLKQKYGNTPWRRQSGSACWVHDECGIGRRLGFSRVPAAIFYHWPARMTMLRQKVPSGDQRGFPF